MAEATCDVCGNEYDRAFRVTTAGGQEHTFDCLECAIQALAPTCDHCGVRVVGHGVQADERVFCCAHCASQEGVTGVADRV